MFRFSVKVQSSQQTQRLTKETKMMYTVMGYWIKTAEQARTVYMVAKLKGNEAAAKQAKALIDKLP